MDTFFTGQGFYLRGKVRDLLLYLQQFNLNQSVADFTRCHLN
ncbi:MAG: hypothetical protein ACM3NT_10465 [Methylocystaceae bacterium]